MIRRPRGARPRPGARAVGAARTGSTPCAVVGGRARPGCCDPGGCSCVEHADVQGEVGAGRLLAATRSGMWLDVADHRDLAGRDRYATAADRARRKDGRRERLRSTAIDCDEPAERAEGLDVAAARRCAPRRARRAADRHRLRRRRRRVHPDAVAALLAAKGRGRDMPVPVLVGSPRTLDGLADRRQPDGARALVEAFWPGGADPRVPASRPRCTGTSATPAAPSRVRMPLHPVALELLRADRPDGGLQREPLRPAAGHDRRRGGRAARRRRRRLPRRRPVAGAAVPSTIVDVHRRRCRGCCASGTIAVEPTAEVVAPEVRGLTASEPIDRGRSSGAVGGHRAAPTEFSDEHCR